MIDYSIIHDSISYYETKGFERIESPWMVPAEIADITKPPNAKNFTILEKDKVLVASGEQSFLDLYSRDALPKGRFQSITPCYRHETVYDLYHQEYFIKNELIIIKDVNLSKLAMIVHYAKVFFERYLKKVDIVQVDDMQFDLCSNGIELGSYGIRECEILKWVYGTGVAEPRLSTVIKEENDKG